MLLFNIDVRARLAIQLVYHLREADALVEQRGRVSRRRMHDTDRPRYEAHLQLGQRRTVAFHI